VAALADAGFQVVGTARNTSRLTARSGVAYLDLDGVMRMTRAVLPPMRDRRGGRVVNISSLSGFVPSPFMAIYVSSKHALEGYSESLDHEVRDQGIRVLLVEPGPINTPFGGNSVLADTPMPSARTFDRTVRKFSRMPT
jgi:short-subunit dehydrogenase